VQKKAGAVSPASRPGAQNLTEARSLEVVRHGVQGSVDAEARTLGATRLGVLGWPVAHSRSPAMHTAALRELGLAPRWSYQRLPVAPELFAETTRALGGAGFHGANVTIPHKQAALALAEEASEAARAIGAANTLTFAPGGTIVAENTDAPGLIAAMERAGHAPRGLTATVLGAGGTARAAVWALREAGAREVSVWNRTPARAQELACAVGIRAVRLPESTDILINCTSVGLVRPASAPESGLNLLSLEHDLVGRYSYVVDFVYAQGTTELLAHAGEQGVPTLDGLELLVAQGALSLERWTGRPIDDQTRSSGRPSLLDIMRRAAREADGEQPLAGGS
jgi:shikimate dehydrogenase